MFTFDDAGIEHECARGEALYRNNDLEASRINRLLQSVTDLIY